LSHPRVFISYSHDSDEHRQRVLCLAQALRDHGVDAELDQYHENEIVDWPRWCRERMSAENCDFIICVCTVRYRQIIDGGVRPEAGKGVFWEASFFDDEIYDAKGNRRILPVLFSGEPESSVPKFLRGSTRTTIKEFKKSDPGFETTLRIVHQKSRITKLSIGTIPALPENSSAHREDLGVVFDEDKISQDQPSPPTVDWRICKHLLSLTLAASFAGSCTAFLGLGWLRLAPNPVTLGVGVGIYLCVPTLLFAGISACRPSPNLAK
jgi:hypothetical protein